MFQAAQSKVQQVGRWCDQWILAPDLFQDPTGCWPGQNHRGIWWDHQAIGPLHNKKVPLKSATGENRTKWTEMVEMLGWELLRTLHHRECHHREGPECHWHLAHNDQTWCRAHSGGTWWCTGSTLPQEGTRKGQHPTRDSEVYQRHSHIKAAQSPLPVSNRRQHTTRHEGGRPTL